MSHLMTTIDANQHYWQLQNFAYEWHKQVNRPEMNRNYLPADILPHMKVREGGRIRSVSALIAVGINEQGYRERLGLPIGDSESEASWTALFTWLKRCGLQGVDLVVSDDHSGLVKAVQIHFQGASWQRCQTHLSRNVCDAVPKPLHDEVHGRLRAICAAPDLPTARSLLERFSEDFAARAPKAVQVLERGFDDATAVLALPAASRQRLRTTNGVERQSARDPVARTGHLHLSQPRFGRSIDGGPAARTG